MGILACVSLTFFSYGSWRGAERMELFLERNYHLQLQSCFAVITAFITRNDNMDVPSFQNIPLINTAGTEPGDMYWLLKIIHLLKATFSKFNLLRKKNKTGYIHIFSNNPHVYEEIEGLINVFLWCSWFLCLIHWAFSTNVLLHIKMLLFLSMSHNI